MLKNLIGGQKEANKNLSNVIKYLDENWTKREIEKFLKKLNKHISIIQSQPDSFPKTNNFNVRRSVVSKQITLYYSFSQETLNIVSLFDNYEYNGSLEMNGIAYDSISKTMYITGKMWPKVYKIKLD